MSCTKVLERRPLDSPGGFRRHFAHHFARFLQRNYRNPEAVAAAFGVRFNTACNWWNAANRPSGDSAALAFLMHPELAEFLRSAR